MNVKHSYLKPCRFEIYKAALPKIGGSVCCGFRPVLVVQNEKGNNNSDTVIVAAITGKQKPWLPTHVEIGRGEGLDRVSTIMCEQIRTLPDYMLVKRIGAVSDSDKVRDINYALARSLGLTLNGW